MLLKPTSARAVQILQYYDYDTIGLPYVTKRSTHNKKYLHKSTCAKDIREPDFVG